MSEVIGSRKFDGSEYQYGQVYCSQGKLYNVEYGDVDEDGGSGIDGACGRVRQWYSHGGEDGWGCCGGTRDGLEKEGKRGSDCSN